MDIFQIGVICDDEASAFRFAVSLGLLNVSSVQCPRCASNMNVERGKVRHGVNALLVCVNRNCSHTRSIFKNTIFENKHQTVGSIIKVIYCWSISFAVRKAVSHCHMGSLSVCNWYKALRRLSILYYLAHFPAVLGGNQCVVEVDETHIFTRKYHRGRVLASESVWVVGAICRQTKKVALRIVRRRNAEVLTRFVVECIAPGTTIITDMWRGYSNLEDNKFRHLKVNHSVNFVDPVDRRIHTNTIERCWRSLKEYIPKSIPESGYEEYVMSFLYKKELDKEKELDKFDFVVNMIREFYGQ